MMKYADLPPFEVHLNLCIKYVQNTDRKFQLTFLQTKNGLIAFERIESAIRFLHKNPEFEVSDKFYGNNFPFLVGNYSNYHPQVVLDLDREKFPFSSTEISERSDFVDLPDHDWHAFSVFINESAKKGLYVSCIDDLTNKYYFATNTYEEILERFSVLRIMKL